MIFRPKPQPVATVAINLRPRSGSWGGANQWTTQLTRYLRASGYKVQFELTSSVDCAIMTHTGLSKDVSFGFAEVRRIKATRPLPCIHRINDNDIRKGTDAMDVHLQRSDEVSDHTVYVSEWLRDHHASKWFDLGKPHSVISPGADPAVFHPIGNQPHQEAAPFRLVTHHWSDNMAKGFDIYAEIDALIASGRIPKVELWIIGRWPETIQWRSARTLPPSSGPALAALLRQCHGYISASRFEPGAMHVVEGLQCGLPLLYHPDTGGTVEMGRRYGRALSSDLAGSIQDYLAAYPGLRRQLLQEPPSGDLMCLSYRRLVQRLLAGEF